MRRVPELRSDDRRLSATLSLFWKMPPPPHFGGGGGSGVPERSSERAESTKRTRIDTSKAATKPRIQRIILSRGSSASNLAIISLQRAPPRTAPSLRPSRVDSHSGRVEPRFSGTRYCGDSLDDCSGPELDSEGDTILDIACAIGRLAGPRGNGLPAGRPLYSARESMSVHALRPQGLMRSPTVTCARRGAGRH